MATEHPPRLRGLNLGGWLSQIDAIQGKDPEKFPGIDKHIETFITAADFANVAQWGFDHVRVPIDSCLFFTDNEKPINSRLVNIDRAVALSKQHELKIILDLHECPGHDFADAANAANSPVQRLFSGDDTCLKKTEKIWACLAERYGSNEHILFESLNEPVAPTAAIWNTVKDRLCREIRRHAPKSTVITGPNMWNRPSAFGELTPFDDDNVVYSVHFYEPLLFTHQFAPWLNEPEMKVVRTYPSDYGPESARKNGLALSKGIWDRGRLAEELAPVDAFGKKYGVSIICDEFGVYAPVELGAQLRWYDDLLSVLMDMGIGFSYWNYKNLDFGIISAGERLHEALPQYDNAERINHSVLDVLRKY
ncbi:MAG: glycoside hydrolase family 5 protein [Chitinispirillales bacterium]|jgi:aryl-phospho-beta-D-glucosidase BglC (GH1 family)|nr:glycoside hydrolase family 5 protein [Chitinispirillales bacterium]